MKAWEKEPTTIQSSLIRWISIIAGVVIMAVLIPLGLDWRLDSEETYRASIEQSYALKSLAQETESIDRAVRDLTDNVSVLYADRVVDLKERLIQLELSGAIEGEFAEADAVVQLDERLNDVQVLIDMKSEDYSGRNIVLQQELGAINEKIIELETTVVAKPKMMIQQQAEMHFEKYHKK